MERPETNHPPDVEAANDTLVAEAEGTIQSSRIDTFDEVLFEGAVVIPLLGIRKGAHPFFRDYAGL